jgi:hypothetical protein
MTDNLPNSLWGEGYKRWLTELKQRVERARLRAATSVNRELVTLYWQIGREILDRQQRQGWAPEPPGKLIKCIANAIQ